MRERDEKERKKEESKRAMAMYIRRRIRMENCEKEEVDLKIGENVL